MCALVASSCAPVQVWRRSAPALPSRLSGGPDALLDAAGLHDLAQRDPDAALARWLAAPSMLRKGDVATLTTAELAALAAKRVSQPAAHWLLCAQQAQQLLAAEDPALRGAGTRLWNTAIRQTVALWQQAGRPEAVVHSVHGRRLHLFKNAADAECHSEEFESLEPADQLRQTGLRERHVRAGIGLPLIASRPNRGESPLDRHRPAEGIVWPATAVLAADGTGASCRMELRLLDPGHCQTVRICGHTHPLAADFTAPWATLLSRCAEMRRTEYSGVFRPDAGERPPVLQLTEPFHRDRIPLVLVHGFMDSPLTWRHMVNELRGDPEVQRRYQIWQFHYPTGVTPLLAGKWLREDLERVRRLVDPGLRSRAVNEMVVIGHSMGGILARTLVCDSGDAVWESIARVRPEELQGSAEDRDALRGLYFFKPLPYVKRVIFMAVPHRGAEIASSVLGRAGRLLIRPPELVLSALHSTLTLNPGAWQLPAEVIRRDLTVSVGVLAPDSPVIRAVGALHIPVPHDSIIGQWLPGEKESGSDAVVPWSSSHLDSAQREIIVRYTHNVPKSREAIRETLKLLKQ